MYNIVKDLSEKDINDVSTFFALKNVSNNSVVKNKDLYEKGRVLYLLGDFKNKKIPACSSCHGTTGEGNFLAGFPKLKSQHSQYVKQQLQAYKDGERSNDYNMIMRDIASNLTEEQMMSVAEYINNM
jgi:cytochrome c553